MNVIHLTFTRNSNVTQSYITMIQINAYWIIGVGTRPLSLIMQHKTLNIRIPQIILQVSKGDYVRKSVMCDLLCRYST